MIERGASTGPISPGQDEEQVKELENWQTNFQEQFKDIYVTYRREAIDQLIKNNPNILNDPALHDASVNALNDYLELDTFGFNQAVALSETFLKNNPELFQTEEFKQMAKDNLIYSLENNSIEPERVLTLKQRFVDEEPSVDEEFKSAALIGLKDTFASKHPKVAKRIIDTFLGENAEIKEMIHEAFLEVVKHGELSRVEEFIQVFNLDIKELKKDPDITQSAESGTIEGLQELAGMNKRFYPESLKLAKEFHRYFFSQDKEGFLKLSQQALITSLNHDFIQNAVYIKTKVLNQNPELVESDEIKKTAQNALEHAQENKYPPKDIELIKNNFLI